MRLFVALLMLSVASVSAAHDRDAPQADFSIDGPRVLTTLRFAASDDIDPQAYVHEQIAVREGGTECPASDVRASRAEGDLRVETTFTCGSAPARLTVTMFGLRPREAMIARIGAGPAMTQRVLTDSSREIEWLRPAELKGATQTAPPPRWPAILAFLVVFFAAYAIASRRRKPS